MPNEQKKFKRPPKKYQPRGMTIIYEDNDILVIDKVSGLLTMSTEKEKEKTAYFLLTNYVRKGNPKSKNRIFIVHRLDRDTSGIIIFAKNEVAKNFLQDQWQSFSKKYFAVVHGKLQKKEDIITSYLAENSIHKMYSVDESEDGKLAKTGYKVLKESSKFSLVEIDLFTGRKNQIRVHFSDMGCPVAGDKIYGNNDKDIKRLALHGGILNIIHPVTKEKMTFHADMPLYFKSLIK